MKNLYETFLLASVFLCVFIISSGCATTAETSDDSVKSDGGLRQEKVVTPDETVVDIDDTGAEIEEDDFFSVPRITIYGPLGIVVNVLDSVLWRLYILCEF